VTRTCAGTGTAAFVIIRTGRAAGRRERREDTSRAVSPGSDVGIVLKVACAFRRRPVTFPRGAVRARNTARRRLRRRPAGQAGGADGRRRAGRGGRADRRQAVRVGPDVALRVADAGPRRPAGRRGAVPGRVAPTVRGQRCPPGVGRRVHVRPVQGRAPKTAVGRGRTARGCPAQDERPERISGSHMHVPHAAQRGPAAGRHVQGHRRHHRVHAGQAHELHARLQPAQRRSQVRLGRVQLRARVQFQVHRSTGRFSPRQSGHGVQRSLSQSNPRVRMFVDRGPVFSEYWYRMWFSLLDAYAYHLV